MTIKQLGGVFGRNPTFNDVTIEGQLTFDGDIDVNSDLKVDGDLDVTGGMTVDTNTLVVDASGNKVGIGCTDPSFRLEINDGSSSIISLTRDDPTIGNANSLGQVVFRSTEDSRSTINIGANIVGVSDAAHSTSSAPTAITFGTTPSGSTSPTERLRISSAGNVTVSTGNLVIGTSGKGIDFSATAGTGTSELLDDYEEGTWTPGFEDAGSVTYTATPYGSYTKIGRTVHVQALISWSAFTAGGNLRLGGLPFAPVAVGNSINTLNVVVDSNDTPFKTVYEYIATGIMFFRSNTLSASSNPYGASGSIIISGTYLA
jgi:hypothetical protein